MWKKMNLPNKLSIIRILMVPLYVVAMYLFGVWKYMNYVALGIYVLASISDYVDGYIAKKKGLVTTFGKLIDPLADKILVAAGFIMLTEADIIPAWITFIMIGRDLLMNTLRIFAVESGVAIAAGVTGKIKTAFQMIGVCLAMVGMGDKQGLFYFLENGRTMGIIDLSINALMTVSIVTATVFTIWSCVEYFIKNGKYIDVEK